MKIGTNLCNQCNNKQCIFQSGICRNDCEFFIPKKKNEDCVSRQEVLNTYADWHGYGYNNGFYRLVQQMPSVEPERKTGKWIWEDGNIPYCSNCKKYSDDADMQDIHGEVLYCSHCGAKMEVNDVPMVKSNTGQV